MKTLGVAPAPRLVQTYPNPFNASTLIQYEMPWARHIRLEAFDVLGRSVAVLLDGRQEAGKHTLRWDPDDLPSGVYMIRLDGGSRPVTTRVMLLR
jgi:hypothetical protein